MKDVEIGWREGAKIGGCSWEWGTIRLARFDSATNVRHTLPPLGWMLVKLKWMEGVGATGGFIPDDSPAPIVQLRYAPLVRPLRDVVTLHFALRVSSLL